MFFKKDKDPSHMGRSASESIVKSKDNILGKPYTDLTQDFTLGKELGKGQFGVVYKVTRNKTGKFYACKQISKKSLGGSKSEAAEDVRREVAIMQHLSTGTTCPYIVKLYDTYEDKNNVSLIMEICEGGELFDRIAERGNYSERRAVEVFKNVLETVHFCHQKGIMHRDLKPENFFLLDTSPDAPLKLSDFGVSQFFKPGQTFADSVGSPFYIAPEVLKGKHSFECDVWSCGVILYILLCGQPPFWSKKEKEIFALIKKGNVSFADEPWPQISSHAKDLISKMLTMDPKARISAGDALNHPWFTSGTAPDKALSGVLKKLKSFAQDNKFKKMALRVAANFLSPKEITELKAIFRQMDNDGSGTISFLELKDGLRKVGSKMTEDDIAMLMASVDTDHSGVLDIDEFIVAAVQMNRTLSEDQLLSIFQHFDRDNSGSIDAHELREVLNENGEFLTPQDLHDILRDADANNDGKIDYQEFCAMMLRTRNSARPAARKRINTLHEEHPHTDHHDAPSHSFVAPRSAPPSHLLSAPRSTPLPQPLSAPRSAPLVQPLAGQARAHSSIHPVGERERLHLQQQPRSHSASLGGSHLPHRYHQYPEESRGFSNRGAHTSPTYDHHPRGSNPSGSHGGSFQQPNVSPGEMERASPHHSHSHSGGQEEYEHYGGGGRCGPPSRAPNSSQGVHGRRSSSDQYQY